MLVAQNLIKKYIFISTQTNINIIYLLEIYEVQNVKLVIKVKEQLICFLSASLYFMSSFVL